MQVLLPRNPSTLSIALETLLLTRSVPENISFDNFERVAAQVELPEFAAELPAVVFDVVHLKKHLTFVL